MVQPSLAQAIFTSQFLSQAGTEPKESIPFPVEALSDYHDDINYSAEQFLLYTEESWKGHFSHSTVLSEGPTAAKVLTWLSYKGTILTCLYRRYSFDFLFVVVVAVFLAAKWPLLHFPLGSCYTTEHDFSDLGLHLHKGFHKNSCYHGQTDILGKHGCN